MTYCKSILRRHWIDCLFTILVVLVPNVCRCLGFFYLGTMTWYNFCIIIIVMMSIFIELYCFLYGLDMVMSEIKFYNYFYYYYYCILLYGL